MNVNPILLQKKYACVVELFANQNQITLDIALDFFYHSNLYKLINEGCSDIHCMSDEYLAQDLTAEYKNM